MTRQSVRKRKATPRRREAPQEDRTWWEYVATPALLRRCHYRCERCNKPLGTNLERHHRMRRRDGGDRLANLLALHTDCHRYITEHPTEAKANGWIVPPGAMDPALTPVAIDGRWWLLDDDGEKHPVP